MQVFDLTEVQADVHPRHAAAPADQVLPHRAGGRARRADAHDRRARPRSSTTTTLLRRRCPTSWPRSPRTLRHPAPHGAARVGRRQPSTAARGAARGRRRPVPGPALLHRAARAHRRRRRRCRAAATGPRTTSSSRPSRPRPAARSACDHAAGRIVRLAVLDLPGAAADRSGRPSLAGGAPLVGVRSTWSAASSVLALLAALAGRRPGSRSAPRRAWSSGSPPTYPATRTTWRSIRLEDGDARRRRRRAGDRRRGPRVRHHRRAAAALPRVRGTPAGPPGGRHGRHPAGRGQRVVFFGAVDPGRDGVVVTVAGSSTRCPAPMPGSAEGHPVRASTRRRAGPPAACAASGSCKGEDSLRRWPGPVPHPARAATAAVRRRPLPRGRPASGRLRAAHLPAGRGRGRPGRARRRGSDRGQRVTAPRCSQVAAAQGEPLPATAPLARTWVVLEQPGPYGRKALHDSHLPAAVGDAFAAATEGTAVTVLLARNAAAHPDRHRPDPRRFWIAHVSPGGARMRSGRVDDLHELVARRPAGSHGAGRTRRASPRGVRAAPSRCSPCAATGAVTCAAPSAAARSRTPWPPTRRTPPTSSRSVTSAATGSRPRRCCCRRGCRTAD